jgi:hypothetical protein
MPSEPTATVVAYQRVRLQEIRHLYNELDSELDHRLSVERSISGELDSLDEAFGDIRRTLRSLEADLRDPETDTGSEDLIARTSPKDRRVEPKHSDNFQDLVREAESHLANMGLDLRKDPLLQVLDSSEVAEIQKRFKDSFGDVRWDESDYLVVFLAGFIATLLDIFLVRIPSDGTFLGRMQQGSPLTRWIKENSKSVHDEYLGSLEKAAKVPYDASVGYAVEGLRPKVHRLMSLGHDPILGFIFGIIDVMSGTGTYIDKNGDLRRLATSMNPEGLVVAFLKVFLHLLSDVFTSAGIQPPFFTLLQLVRAKSPFILGPSGERVSWTDVARYMYAHGYDLRHFATMGIIPASVEMIVRGWWLCTSFESRDEAEIAKAKLTSMILLGHVIVTSGNLLKTGLIFGMNPLALNWAQMLRTLPVTVAWIGESVKRDRAIRTRLDAEWLSLYRADLGHSA